MRIYLYEKDNYALLKKDETFDNLVILANFWNDISNQSVEKFSDRVLRKLFVLNYAPNGMWTYFVSVYFMKNHDPDCTLEDEPFFNFLNKTIGFIWTYAITNPGVNALRTPVYSEMIKIVNNMPVDFEDYKFELSTLKSVFDNFNFYNGRPITKSMLAWWAFENDAQELLSMESIYEIEHIYARSRHDKENALQNPKNIDALGNKSLLEKRINIRASDYKFEDKKKYYTGYINSRGQNKQGTQIQELLQLASQQSDFTEADIQSRNNDILTGFFDYLKDVALLK